MKRFVLYSVLFFAAALTAISLSACATNRAAYRSELTQNPKFEEANISYKKALRLIRDGDAVPEPERAAQNYEQAESCLADAIFKLKEIGHENGIDVSEDVYYCQKIQGETHSKKGGAHREAGPR